MVSIVSALIADNINVCAGGTRKLGVTLKYEDVTRLVVCLGLNFIRAS